MALTKKQKEEALKFLGYKGSEEELVAAAEWLKKNKKSLSRDLRRSRNKIKRDKKARAKKDAEVRALNKYTSPSIAKNAPSICRNPAKLVVNGQDVAGHDPKEVPVAHLDNPSKNPPPYDVLISGPPYGSRGIKKIPCGATTKPDHSKIPGTKKSHPWKNKFSLKKYKAYKKHKGNK